jgi:hypothetical protein
MPQILLVALLLAAHVAQSASAQAQPSHTPSLSDALEPLAFFTGQWTCEGTFIKSGKPIASQLRFEPALDGAWLQLRADDLPPNRFHALELWGFDSKAKQFKNFIFDNFGGARLFTSSGWAGDTLTWSGDVLSGKPESDQQFVFERKSPSAFAVTWQVRSPGQDWTVGDRLTCNRPNE